MKIMMPMLVIFSALVAGCEQERVIDNAQLQFRNHIAYEINSSDPYTGSVIGYYSDGQKKLERHFVNGVHHDRRTDWYENGKRIKQRNEKRIAIRRKHLPPGLIVRK